MISANVESEKCKIENIVFKGGIKNAIKCF